MSNLDPHHAYELSLQRWLDFANEPAIADDEWLRTYANLKKDLREKMTELERHLGVPIHLRG